MRTTVSVEDTLYDSAVALLDPGVESKELFRESLKVFVRVQSAKRLAEMGGKIKNMKTVPRRRSA